MHPGQRSIHIWPSILTPESSPLHVTLLLLMLLLRLPLLLLLLRALLADELQHEQDQQHRLPASGLHGLYGELSLLEIESICETRVGQHCVPSKFVHL